MPEDKGEAALDHSCSLEFSRDPSRGIARPQHHELLPRRRNGQPQRPRQPAANSEDGKQQDGQKPSQVTDSLDEDWPWVVGRWSLAFGRWPLQNPATNLHGFTRMKKKRDKPTKEEMDLN
jgi:hypothetical protein